MLLDNLNLPEYNTEAKTSFDYATNVAFASNCFQYKKYQYFYGGKLIETIAYNHAVRSFGVFFADKSTPIWLHRNIAGQEKVFCKLI